MPGEGAADPSNGRSQDLVDLIGRMKVMCKGNVEGIELLEKGDQSGLVVAGG